MIKAHLVGIFYRGLGPEAEPLIDVGDGVEEGDTVGMIESMRNLMEVRSAVRGRVETVLVAEGQPVEYGQELFEVDVTAEP
jgi:biotin carboxyl carrier protein